MTVHSTTSLSDQQVCEVLRTFSIAPGKEQVAKIREYISLLLKWNRTVSLTTVTDPLEIVRRHFGESMFSVNLLPVENCRLADFGTGAGFPGLALKIAAPNIQVELIESNKKKCAFLAEAIRVLELSGVNIHSQRLEQIRPNFLHVNIVTARAVGEFKLLLRWASEALSDGGEILLWLGAEDATRIATNSGWIWQPAIKIPDSQRRFILVGHPAARVHGQHS